MERLFGPISQKQVALPNAHAYPLAFSKLWILCVILVICCTQHAQADSTGRIVKWKDEKGVTHYGDSIPTQYINRENSLINRQGVTVKHNKPAQTQSNQDELAKIEYAKSEQAKKDKALLGAFTNANEIDLALERNIQLDKIALENLQQERANHQKSLDAKKIMATSYEKKKKSAPQELKTEIANEESLIEVIDQKIAARTDAIEVTRQRFDDDKKRYILLKSQSGKTAQ